MRLVPPVERDAVSNLNWTAGAVLIGIFVNVFFYGVVFYQFVSYYAAKFSDPLWIRIVVMSLLIIDTFQSCAMLYVPWYLLIKNYNNPQALGDSLWEYGITPVFDSVAAAITQVFLVHRIYRLSKRIAICIPILVLILAGVVLGLATGVYAISLRQISDAHTIPTTVPWLSVQAFTDILISGILCWIFYHSRTGNRKTDWALKTLFRKSIQTGIPAAAVALGILLAWIILGTQNNRIFAALTFAHGRIYTLVFRPPDDDSKETTDIAARHLWIPFLFALNFEDRWPNRKRWWYVCPCKDRLQKITHPNNLHRQLRNVRSTMGATQSETILPSQDLPEMRLVRVSSVSAFKDREQYSAGTYSGGTISGGTTSV